MEQLQAPLCPPPRCQTDWCLLTPAPLHCGDTARGSHYGGVGLSMAWAARALPGCTPLFFLLFFYFLT